MKVFVASVLLLTLASLTSACGGGPTQPSTTTVTQVPEVFTGTLSPGDSSFYSFTVTQAGTVSITLVSLSTAKGTVAASMELGFGVPAGTGCGVTSAVQAIPALAAQITNTSTASIYCVDLRDTGGLSAPTAFVVRIVHT